ncbi:hypothetical protein Tco_1318102 [Tanacetum coccineum]
MDNDILNIDCETNIDEIIQDWSNRLSHYANNFPKKGKKKETEIVKVAYDLGYEPLEDSDIDSDIEIYAYTNYSDYSSDTSSSHE